MSHMEEVAGLEALSRELLSRMVRNDRFQDLWAELALEELISAEDKQRERNKTRRNTMEVQNRSQFIATKIRRRTTPTNCGGSTADDEGMAQISSAFHQIGQELNIAVGTFVRGTQMARFECEGEYRQRLKNLSLLDRRDSVGLYMAQLALARFGTAPHFRQNRMGAICRQLVNLLRSFAKSISSVYGVERSAFFADSLLELLVKFYNCSMALCRQQRIDRRKMPIEVQNFAKAVGQFDRLVCETLKKMLECKSNICLRRVSLSLSSVPVPAVRQSLSCRPRRANSLPRIEQQPVLVNGTIAPLPFVKDCAAVKQRSFLLSPSLDYERKQLAIYRGRRKNAKAAFGSEERRIGGNNERAARRNGDNGAWDLLKTLGSEDIAALKETCKTTLDFINEVYTKRRANAVKL